MQLGVRLKMVLQSLHGSLVSAYHTQEIHTNHNTREIRDSFILGIAIDFYRTSLITIVIKSTPECYIVPTSLHFYHSFDRRITLTPNSLSKIPNLRYGRCKVEQ
ncbi:hypothetical protein V1477_002683 [Vespula maculifrons]|uniref:Uncharacterized protein n=1 Tax=Vespula maculifrons TaxID=7453 RepID=A0ABD2CY57_VESMC